MKEYIDRLRPGEWPSPCFVTDLALLRKNAAVLDGVQKRTGAKIMLALKCFSQSATFSVLSRAMEGPLYGCCASSPDEARLAKEEFRGEVHAFAAAWSEDELAETLRYADHVVFNSFAQWRRFRPMVEKASEERGSAVECGLRINPEHSEGAVPIYDPCSPGSRLGIRPAAFRAELERDPHALDGISGLHFHTLCEQDSDSLARTLEAVEKHFGAWFPQMKWINFGGGHHITREGYGLDLLCSCITHVRDTYGVQVYLEPGEAVALNAGFLVATVLDVVQADMPVAILDTSAACHMPDVLEMPYRPGIVGAGESGEKAFTCRLAGKSCLAGDVIGEYSFDAPLATGDRLVFLDMAIYSMVKTTTFNGLRLPSIAVWDSESGERRVTHRFGYEDFKSRI
ncbi:MAG: carboxynorspermidine decarboxylase [Mailhella sp.]|nr:carboxynorspermidine decarboxylase [Mailhella sp.]